MGTEPLDEVEPPDLGLFIGVPIALATMAGLTVLAAWISCPSSLQPCWTLAGSIMESVTVVSAMLLRLGLFLLSLAGRLW